MKGIDNIRQQHSLQTMPIEDLNRLCVLKGYRVELWGWNKIFGAKDYKKRNDIILYKESNL